MLTQRNFIVSSSLVLSKWSFFFGILCLTYSFSKYLSSVCSVPALSTWKKAVRPVLDLIEGGFLVEGSR